MRLSILYFAWVREKIGRSEEEVTPPAEVRDVAGLVAWLAARGGGYAEALGDPARLRAAVDQKFVTLDAALADAREVALFPPVTGGSRAA